MYCKYCNSEQKKIQYQSRSADEAIKEITLCVCSLDPNKVLSSLSKMNLEGEYNLKSFNVVEDYIEEETVATSDVDVNNVDYNTEIEISVSGKLGKIAWSVLHSAYKPIEVTDVLSTVSLRYKNISKSAICRTRNNVEDTTKLFVYSKHITYGFIYKVSHEYDGLYGKVVGEKIINKYSMISFTASQFKNYSFKTQVTKNL